MDSNKGWLLPRDACPLSFSKSAPYLLLYGPALMAEHLPWDACLQMPLESAALFSAAPLFLQLTSPSLFLECVPQLTSLQNSPEILRLLNVRLTLSLHLTSDFVSSFPTDSSLSMVETNHAFVK